MDELRLYEEIVRLKRAGEAAVLATVVAAAGSSPRKAGTKMLVLADGSIIGTIGGGRIEAEAIEAAMAAMRDSQPRHLSFSLDEKNGFACGGSMSVFLEPLGGAARLVVFGAGHIGREVGALAKRCGFHVTVVDPRPHFVCEDRIPEADRLLCLNVEDAVARLDIDAATYVVVATPGHEQDLEVVAAILATNASFIALVGSRKKKASFEQRLAARGHSPEAVARIITPAGVPIAAETPAEIAVSIVAQLIDMRRRSTEGFRRETG